MARTRGSASSARAWSSAAKVYPDRLDHCQGLFERTQLRSLRRNGVTQLGRALAGTIPERRRRGGTS
jgi:hypothetical protein